MVLHDGRRIGYAEFGHGPRTAVWLHGTPGGRRQVPPAARRLAETGRVRVISIERPGTGESTRHLYRSVAEFPDDLREVLDALDVSQCVVVGLSGGGPYALACAHSLDRVRAVGTLGGVAPARGPEAIRGGVSTLAHLAPMVAPFRRPLGGLLSAAVRAAHPLASPSFDLFMRLSTPADRLAFAEPGVKQMLLDDIVRASRIGLHAFLADYLLFSRDWGFALRNIAKPAHVWQGTADPFVALEHGRHLARLIPDASLIVQPDQGHLAGLVIADEVLETVLDSAD